MKISLTIFAFLIFIGHAYAQEKPVASADIMKNALTRAANENKNVLLMFHASWCGWCHKMDTAINDDACKKLFDDHYVIVHLVVMERKGKENLENPGAADMLRQYHGDEQGIPFWLIFNKDGKLLADSKMRADPSSLEGKGDNIGCPVSPEEVAYFASLLKRTSTLDDAQLAIIQDRFRKIK